MLRPSALTAASLAALLLVAGCGGGHGKDHASTSKKAAAPKLQVLERDGTLQIAARVKADTAAHTAKVTFTVVRPLQCSHRLTLSTDFQVRSVGAERKVRPVGKLVAVRAGEKSLTADYFGGQPSSGGEPASVDWSLDNERPDSTKLDSLVATVSVSYATTPPAGTLIITCDES